MKTIIPFVFFQLYFLFAIGQTIDITQVDCTLSPEELARIQNVYELERNYYYSVFGSKNKKVTVEVYGDFDSYKRYQGVISKTSKSNSGFSSSILNAAIVYKKKDFIYVINHEISHLILKENFSNRPKWLDEGLAEYFEYFDYKNNEYQLRIQFHKIERVAKWLVENKVNLKRFLKQTGESWNSNNKKPNFYSSSLSYSIILFLMEKEPQFLKQILLELADGISIQKIINKNYDEGFEEFETKFKEYILWRNESPVKVLKF